jgi:hypothetical protein
MKARASMPALISISLLTFLATTLAAVEQAFSVIPDEAVGPLHAELTAARIAEQTKVAEVLRDLSLDSADHWRGDLAGLNADEHAEMMTALQQEGVALGDRSRLRVWMQSTEAGEDHVMWIDPGQRLSSTLLRTLQESEGKAAAEDNGVSSDTIAIILTGLTAVAGYILQNRQAERRACTGRAVAGV